MPIPEHPYTDEQVQQAAENTPLAGGKEYSPEWADQEPDVVISEPTEFDRADKHDHVHIADGEKIDVAGTSQFNLDGTIVTGSRHDPTVEAGWIKCSEAGPGSVAYDGIFKAENQTGHVEGINLRGPSWHPERAGKYTQEAPIDARCWPGYFHIHKPDPDDPNDNHPNREERDKIRSENFARGINLWTSDSSVRNCDISGFTHAGVTVGAAKRVPTGVEVTHNKIWSCAIPGLGYPLNIYNGEVLSKLNYYNQYRHAITGFGHKTLGYTSRFDVFGPDALLTPVDMHQLGENISDGSNTAGKYLHVDQSSFMAHTRYETPTWYSKDDCPGIGIRGYAAENYATTRCQFLHESREEATSHINVSDKYRDWSFSGNEYTRENWTENAGAPLDFSDTSPEPEPDPVQRDRGVYRKTGIELANNLSDIRRKING